MAALTIGATPRRALAVLLAISAGLWVALLLAGWFGDASIIIAALLWAGSATGLRHAHGDLDWAERYPPAERALAAFAPRADGSDAVKPASPAAVGPPRKAKSPIPAPEAPGDLYIPDVSHFVRSKEADEPQDTIDTIVQDRGLLERSASPAVCVLLAGPRGTGKTSLALSMVARMRKTGIVKSPHVMTVSESSFPGLESTYGREEKVYPAISRGAKDALNGIILLDDLDHLASLDGRALATIGNRLSAVAREQPRRMLIIATSLGQGLDILDPNRQWLRLMDVKIVMFTDFSPQKIKELTILLLGDRGLRCGPEALQMLGSRSRELSGEVEGDFDNAIAVHRFVNRIQDNHNRRIAQKPAGPEEITREDVSNAHARVV